MPSLPPDPVKGKPVRADWGKRLLDYLRGFPLQSGPGIKIQKTANGWTISAKPKGGKARADRAHPWRPYVIERLDIGVSPGTVANRLPANFNAPISIPADQSGYWVWVEVTIIDSGAVTGVELSSGATPPTADLVSVDGSLPTALYAPLFAVDTGADAVARFYPVQTKNLIVDVVNDGGGCLDQRRSVQLIDSDS